MFKKILVPIDGSEQSSRALKVAMDLAKRYSAKVTLVSVAQPYFVTSRYSPQPTLFSIPTTSLYENIENVHKKILANAFDELKKVDSEIIISKRLLKGRPADKIVELAEEEGFDLIVIGSRGLGGIKEFFLGSVSDRVADHAPCPVLIVK